MEIMTPGPTQVRENVRRARSTETTNPDLDPVFYDEYKELCESIGKVLHIGKDGEVFILSGEGILGLEAACASLTEPGDRVLVLDNGEYGAGFADFVQMYGGDPVLYTQPYDETLDVAKLSAYLESDHQFKYATVVHHDTPSGMLNDVHAIGKLLSQYGILSVVDSVSGMIGEYLDVAEGHLDLVCGASQKAVSAPPGLTFVAVSSRAMEAMEQRKTPIASFYANLLVFKGYYEKQWFPYTMPISDIYGLRAAFDNIMAEPEIIERHAQIAEAVRQSVRRAGLSLYGKNGFSNLTTVIRVPEGLEAGQILDYMKTQYHILLAGSFGPFAGKVLRIGHMGENANRQDVADTLEALQKTLEHFGYTLECDMRECFEKLL